MLPAAAYFAAVDATGIGISAALAWLGSGLICASLLLMVREPGFASWFGGLKRMYRMYRWHHALGTSRGQVYDFSACLPQHPTRRRSSCLPAEQTRPGPTRPRTSAVRTLLMPTPYWPSTDSAR